MSMSMYPAPPLGTWACCLCFEGSCKEAQKDSGGGSGKAGGKWSRGTHGGGVCGGVVGPDDGWKIRVIPRELCVSAFLCSRQ